jgi:3-hydroxybutyryl-CoA dehydrogenase
MASAADQAAFHIRTVAVIGAGDQGRAFALHCARSGFQTVLEDVMPARLRRAGQELAAVDPEAAGRLCLATTVEDAVREADLTIDFVPDELESKLEIFSLVDRMAPPKTILCTPTTALSISDLASCTYRAERCIALQSDGRDLVSAPLRLIPGAVTAPEIVTAVTEWLSALGNAVSAGSDRPR